MLLMIDNYDSFTYNLVQYFAELGADVEVHRNDEITIEQIEQSGILQAGFPFSACAWVIRASVRHSAGASFTPSS
jgi:anthranilate synthase component 2